jgi:hypothetical protein
MSTIQNLTAQDFAEPALVSRVGIRPGRRREEALA